MLPAVPRRYRHPIDDPDPVLARRYRELFDTGLDAPAAQVDALARALSRGDPAADAWVAYVRGQPARATGMLERALRDGSAAVPEAPPALCALLAESEAVPAWVDRARLVFGGRVLRRVGLFGHFVLADFGLMGGYRSAAVARSLSLTGRLRDGAPERLIETGRFVTCVTEPGALWPGEEGYRAAVRIRVVHAHVRHALASAPGWSVEEWGVPISQADMLATNLLFSMGLVVGARQLGFHFRADEVDAVVHLWRYAGYLLGIEEALLPSDEAGALRAMYLVGVSQPGPSDESVVLARALHRIPLTFADRPWKQRLARVEMGLRASLTRRMLGEEASAELGLPRSAMRHCVPLLVGAIRGAERLRTRVPGADELTARAGDVVLKAAQRALAAKMRARKAAEAANARELGVDLATRAPCPG